MKFILQNNNSLNLSQKRAITQSKNCKEPPNSYWERADLLALVCGVFCEFVTFPLVSWVRCGTWLYRFLIFAPYLLWLSELFCLCCVAALKSLFALSFNALIFPILRIVCTISFHYSCPWISSMSCTAFKITRWPIFIPRCITSAFYIPMDLY